MWATQTRLGAVTAALVALTFCAAEAFGLTVYLETTLRGGHVRATVLSVYGAPGYQRDYALTYMWEGERRYTHTEWIPDDTEPDETVSVYVNRRDPGTVVGAGTVGLRASRSPLMLCPAALLAGFAWVLYRIWRRHNPDPRRPVRPRRPWVVPAVAPNRAERPARRRR
ncbi:hypothetical protein [Catenuloplanes indicus]|uniref:DUF3592 domain-containing protein n=1 Tax=Catenuloplanes indicus TaxID=137267 RepID=A0AAE3VUR8_9ACTN|nr:hypothetical protein [Catenuloplanes indicus]MDQ0364044.1 hypothetical protein [Catenuloplanes indicus]